MNPTGKSRRQMLEEFLAINPNDAFARYGLAMECARLGEHEAAADHFRQLLSAHPDYLYGYFHYAQLLARMAHADEAKRILAEGITAAQKAGDAKARDEMEGALREIA